MDDRRQGQGRDGDACQQSLELELDLGHRVADQVHRGCCEPVQQQIDRAVHQGPGAIPEGESPVCRWSRPPPPPGRRVPTPDTPATLFSDVADAVPCTCADASSDGAKTSASAPRAEVKASSDSVFSSVCTPPSRYATGSQFQEHLVLQDRVAVRIPGQPPIRALDVGHIFNGLDQFLKLLERDDGIDRPRQNLVVGRQLRRNDKRVQNGEVGGPPPLPAPIRDRGS